MTQDARPPSWRALILGLLVFNAAVGALSATQPSDLYWITAPIAQVGVLAALLLAVAVPAFDFLRVFFRRLGDLNHAAPMRAIAAHVGLGAVASTGAMLGRAFAGATPHAGAIDAGLVFIANTIAAALMFLLTARLIYHRSQRTQM